MQNNIVYIEGMHCASCVKLITEEFMKVEGVKKVDVNLKKKEANIQHELVKLDLAKLDSLINPFGFSVSNEKKKIKNNNLFQNWFVPIVITLVIVVLFLYLQRSGLIEIFSSKGDKVSFSFAFLTGLVASVSSCFAVVGSIVISFGTLYRSENNSENSLFGSIKSNLLFHVGRLSSFFILGGLLGLIGGSISLSGRFVGITNIVISIIMLLLGLNVLGLVPSITQFGVKMPNFFTGNISNMKKSRLPFVPLLLGFITFFLPCGFTQSMQIFAITSGSFIKGGLTLLLFALGTLPILFMVGVTAKMAQSPKLMILKRVGAFLIIVFAIYTFTGGLSVINFKGNLFNNDLASNQNKTLDNNTNNGDQNLNNSLDSNNKPNTDTQNEKIQTVEMSIKYYGFEPRVIKIKNNVKVRWEIYGEEVTGCTNAIVFPFIKKRFVTPRNEKVIVEFTPDKKGYLPFSCWMGMVKGAFLVE